MTEGQRLMTRLDRRKVLKELVAETVRFYSKDPANRRSKVSGSCAYHGEGGKCCAFSRVCVPGTDLSQHDEHPANAHEVLKIHGESILPEKYRGYPPKFWDKLQLLHDDNLYWCKDGLTPAGLVSAGKLIQDIVEGLYDPVELSCPS